AEALAATGAAANAEADAEADAGASKPFDVAIFTAAVADFCPEERQEHKLKKSEQGKALTLHLVPNPDILKTFSQKASAPRPSLIVGFAAETRDVLDAAHTKLREKGADLIVANDVSSPDLGFASVRNRWYFVSSEGVEMTDVLHKRTLARLLLDRIVRALEAREEQP
ncbi:MAG: phosphopantothenoylcysteine decarboxylase, partial [Coriobacteriales bacterium]|nr:phosphopantothenoylcysteine decarboxylase [Coriobacteriales bacterium]